jgi:hypothetical protein
MLVYLFGADPDQNKVTWKTPSSRAFVRCHPLDLPLQPQTVQKGRIIWCGRGGGEVYLVPLHLCRL